MRRLNRLSEYVNLFSKFAKSFLINSLAFSLFIASHLSAISLKALNHLSNISFFKSIVTSLNLSSNVLVFRSLNDFLRVMYN